MLPPLLIYLFILAFFSLLLFFFISLCISTFLCLSVSSCANFSLWLSLICSSCCLCISLRFLHTLTLLLHCTLCCHCLSGPHSSTHPPTSVLLSHTSSLLFLLVRRSSPSISFFLASLRVSSPLPCLPASLQSGSYRAWKSCSTHLRQSLTR